MQKTVDLLCTNCQTSFTRLWKNHLTSAKHTDKFFCCRKCKGAYKAFKVELTCLQCNSIFQRTESHRDDKRKKSTNVFCSSSCAAIYNNTHKTTGTRRSKLESWLEEQLIILYPNLDFKFNSKEEINSELDIYIPSLKLAFELNGIFHYEPIYGSEKLTSIQNNDHRKFAACQDANISLCIIDCSSHKYVTPKSSQKYLDIISNIINSKLSITED